MIITTCITLKRYYAYRVLTNPANQAPLAASSYYDKKTNSYKPLSNKVSKYNLKDINDKILHNKKLSSNKHIPPLIHDCLDDNFNRYNHTNSIDKLFELLEEQKMNQQHSYHSMHHDHLKNTSNSNSEENTNLIYSEFPRMRRKTFKELRQRFLADTELKYKERKVVEVQEIYDHGKTRSHSPDSDMFSSEGPAGCSDLRKIKGPGIHTRLRMEALEYALKIDKLLIKIDDRDPRLKRSLDTAYDKHFTIIRELKSKNDDKFYGKKLYNDELMRVPIKSVFNISTHLKNIRYGSDVYTLDNLEETKEMIDRFCNEIIEHSSISSLSKYYKNID